MASKSKKTKKQETPPPEEEPVEEKKPFSFWDIQFRGLEYIFTEESVANILGNSRQKQALMEFCTQMFKRKGLEGKIEYNEMNILTDFHLYNLAFAKDQLLLPNDKAALLLDIFATLLSFGGQPDPLPRDDSQEEIDNSKQQVEIRPEVEEKENLENELNRKFTTFKELLMLFAVENEPYSKKVFSQDEVIKILKYIKDSYFKYFRLYSYVLSNKQLCEIKNITVFIDHPLPIPPLSAALGLGKEKLQIDDENHEEEEVDKLAEKAADLTSPKESAREEEKEPKEETLDEAVEKLNIDPESKKALEFKIQQFQQQIDEKLKERQDALTAKVEEAKKAKTVKKPPAKK